jgi:hypothetical protein
MKIIFPFKCNLSWFIVKKGFFSNATTLIYNLILILFNLKVIILSKNNYIQNTLKIAFEKPDNDFHLAFHLHGEKNFFDNNEYKDQWINRLYYFEEIDITQHPLIEAIYYYGKWKLEKKFELINKSLERFLKAEESSISNKWQWILTECVSDEIEIFFKLGKKDDLSLLANRISKYIIDGKDILTTRTIKELSKSFIELLDFVKKPNIESIYEIIFGFAKNEQLNISFREGFFEDCVTIKTHLSDDKTVQELHNMVLKLKLDEAEKRGISSKLLKSGLLEQALNYCITYVHDEELIRNIKKQIQDIDYSDELATIELPKEMKEKLNEAYLKNDEYVKKSVEKYIDTIKGKPPLQILYGVLNDESIFRMDVEETKDFTKKLLKNSISNIFSTTLDLEFKQKKIETAEEKFDYNLHKHLLNYLYDNINLIYYITSKIQDENIINIRDIYEFISHCDLHNDNDSPVIIWGILRHYEEDYISSVSILTPKIESTLFLYLQKIGADITAYNPTEISKRSLGGLIELDEVSTHFSIDFQYFLKLLLISDDALCFRNRLSHGASNIREFNKTTSLVVIFLILKIFAKTFNIPK